MAKRAPKVVEVGEPLTESGPAHAVTLLSQIIGHERAKGVLQASLASGRVHHAWIFHGPAGVGKLTAAVAFAATLLDPTTAPNLSGELEPDPDSQVQRLVRAGTHPDLRIVTKELAAVSADDRTRAGKQITLPIEVIREFVIDPASKSRSMAHQPVGGSGGDAGGTRAGRVFIIDEAELMDQRTQNVLLKTMEEPPAGCVIILVTASEDRLLPTIRSRSQRVGFCPLGDQEMHRWLERRTPGEGEAELSPQRGAWVLRFAGGSPGLAEVAIRYDLFAWQEQLGPMLELGYRGKFSPDLGTAMAKIIDDRAAEAVKGRPEASKDAANKQWARRMLAFVAEDARARLRGVGGLSGVKAATPDPDAVRRAIAAIDAVADAERHLGSNVSMAFLLDALAGRISA